MCRINICGISLGLDRMSSGRESSERDLHIYVTLISHRADMSFSEKKDYSVKVLIHRDNM